MQHRYSLAPDRRICLRLERGINYTNPVYYPSMKNITLSLDDDTAAWARVHAAQQNMSLSRFVGELLQATMRESHAYEVAMQLFLSKPPLPLSSVGKNYPSRAELYD